MGRGRGKVVLLMGVGSHVTSDCCRGNRDPVVAPLEKEEGQHGLSNAGTDWRPWTWSKQELQPRLEHSMASGPRARGR